MKIGEFKIFVEKNSRWFQSEYKETIEDISSYEERLGFGVPDSMSWLLSEYGYTRACGVENLEGSMLTTLECRDSIELPNNILIINDWGDGGLVYCVADADSDHDYEIIWSDTADIYNLIEGKPLPDNVGRYKNFAIWVEAQLEAEIEESKH